MQLKMNECILEIANISALTSSHQVWSFSNSLLPWEYISNNNISKRWLNGKWKKIKSVCIVGRFWEIDSHNCLLNSKADGAPNQNVNFKIRQYFMINLTPKTSKIKIKSVSQDCFMSRAPCGAINCHRHTITIWHKKYNN